MIEIEWGQGEKLHEAVGVWLHCDDCVHYVIYMRTLLPLDSIMDVARLKGWSIRRKGRTTINLCPRCAAKDKE